MSSDENMEKAFQRSFASWLEKEGEDSSPEPFESVESAIQYYGLTIIETDGAPAFPGHRVLLTQCIRDLFQQMEQPYAACESPMERMFLSAMLALSRQRDYAVTLHARHGEVEFPGHSTDDLKITVQAELGEYRVDFLIEVNTLAHSLIYKLPEPFPCIKKQLVVECDRSRARVPTATRGASSSHQGPTVTTARCSGGGRTRSRAARRR